MFGDGGGIPLEIRLLEYFLAVCEELHFTRAADKLGVSQPTLSQQIRLLESRIGMPLFQRIGKKIYITEAGEVLRNHALRALSELEQAQHAVNELKGMQRGRLRIGCSGNHLLTSTVAAFRRHYPGIELSVSEMATEDTREGLLSHRLDIGVVFLPLDDDQLESVPLFNEQLQLAVSPEHPLAGAEQLPLHTLAQLDLLLLPPRFYVRQMIDRYCAERGISLRPVLELSTLESLAHMAKRNMGAAILPKSYVDSVHKGNVCGIPIVDPVPEQPVGVVYRKATFLSAATSTFIEELLRQFAAEDESARRRQGGNGKGTGTARGTQ